MAMTRAKQYICLTAYNPSRFFTYYRDYEPDDTEEELVRIESITPAPYDPRAEAPPAESIRPAIGGYQKKRMSVSVHDLMSTLDRPDSDGKKEGNGREHGDKVHENAYLYLKWNKYDSDVKEMKNVIRIIEDRRRGAKLSGEIKFVLPVDDVSVKGTIDLLAEFGDRIEIHDYKSDLDKEYIDQYRLQLSVYYHAVASMGKKVECYIDFVALGETVPVEPLPMECIRERIDAYKESLKLPD